ncbi:unnamed protein product [Zymoseptoria tritici ST99CH_1A5]|uniref:SnoaL-like domain-containing protein n=1 Tax=Zymoseptoria tritici ST99CH_1A5 TaxID=1276529 RepID=A0A1Y6LV36_ZYMTR|nr:unnamed protein product [Zymoseptoria tritici ST99CH_1A5]
MPQPLSSGQSISSPDSNSSTPSECPPPILPEVHPDCPPPDGTMSPTVELEYLSRVVFLIVRGLDPPPWLEAHISDIFKSEVDNFPSSMTWPQLREMFRIVNRAAKGTYRPIILNVLVDIHEHSTHADVLILIEATGRPVNLRRHTVCRLRWRRREGRWQIYHALAIRSPSLFQFV